MAISGEDETEVDGAVARDAEVESSAAIGEGVEDVGAGGDDVVGRGRYTAGMATARSPEDESAWQAAMAFGIDVTLLEANLERTPAERLRELVAMNQFQAQAQGRGLPEAVRQAMEEAELRAKFGALLDAAL